MFKKTNFLSNSIWIIGIALVVCNVLLVTQNLELKNKIEILTEAPKIKIGEQFGELKATDAENNFVTLTSENAKKVILFTSTSCPYCKKQNPYWMQLVNQLDLQKYEIVEMFNDSEERQTVSDYLKSIGHFDNSKVKILFSNSENLKKFKLNLTPTTLVLDKEGNVEKIWSGLWDKSKADDANSYFNTTIQ
jgi:thiol-disulfide isomerase/thioredoxin